MSSLSLSLMGKPIGHNKYSRQKIITNARYNNGSKKSRFPQEPSKNKSRPGPTVRILAASSYLLPFLDSIHYGTLLFRSVPTLHAIMAPIIPLAYLYHQVPFASGIAFFAVYLGILHNKNLPRFAHINAAQALMIDIILNIPRIFESIMKLPRRGPAAALYANIQSLIWVAVTACVIFCIVKCFVGETGKIPIITEAAEQHVP